MLILYKSLAWIGNLHVQLKEQKSLGKDVKIP